MIFEYNPKYIMNQREEISTQHRKKAPVKEYEISDRFKELIEYIVELKEKHLNTFVISLTEEEIVKIIKYIPSNYYHVDLSNLFEVFKLIVKNESSEERKKLLFDGFYLSWQDSYYHSQCNDFILEYAEKCEDFHDNILSHSYCDSQYVSILSSDDIPFSFGQMAYTFPKIENLSFKEKMAYWDVEESTSLYNDIAFLMLTFCSEKDYKSIGKKKILETIEQYNISQLNKFLINYIKKCSLETLYANTDISRFLQGFTGNLGTKKFDKFFDDCNQTVVDKYINVLNDYWLYVGFGDDDRRRFWRQYKFTYYKNLGINEKNNALIMDMGDTIVTEFVGKGMGKIYFFKRDIFEEKVFKYFQKYRNDGPQLKHILYANSQSDNPWCYEWCIHTYVNRYDPFLHKNISYPSWMDTVNELLLYTHRITTRV